jgi:hypothetical protein
VTDSKSKLGENVTKLPAHHSAVRSLVNEAKGNPYHALRSLEEARSHPQSVIIFEGDDGGTIYLTIPANHCHCDEAELQHLLSDVDARYWKDMSMAKIFYECLPEGSGVAGGMGGGHILDGLWLHPEIEALGIRKEVQEVLQGNRKRIAPVQQP